jgi:hypothetical protein
VSITIWPHGWNFQTFLLGVAVFMVAAIAGGWTGVHVYMQGWDDANASCWWDARRAFAAVIGGPHIEGWNDAPGRRVSEVLDAFTAAAARERGTG